MPNPTTTLITLRLPISEAQRIEELAERLGTSRNDAGKRAINAGLDSLAGIQDNFMVRTLLALHEITGDDEMASKARQLREHLRKQSQKHQQTLPGFGEVAPE